MQVVEAVVQDKMVNLVSEHHMFVVVILFTLCLVVRVVHVLVVC